MIFVQGDPLDYDKIKPSSKDAYLRDRGEVAKDQFLHGGSTGSVEDIKQFHTPSGVVLNTLHSKVPKERLLLPQLLEAECLDRIRRHVFEGKVEIERPFEHTDSTEGGTGTVVMDPMTNEFGYWSVSCPHDACQGKHKLEFLEEMLNAG